MQGVLRHSMEVKAFSEELMWAQTKAIAPR